MSVEFKSEEEGVTRGMFVADAESYGADRDWVLVEAIPIDVGGSSAGGSSPEPLSSDDEN